MTLKLTPRLLKWGLNLWPPFMGAGIKMEYVADNWRESRVSMKLRWYNRNIMAVHFGGSLYAMVDPQLMVMLMQILGKGYRVWDQSAGVEFVKPGRGKVTADLVVTDGVLNIIREKTAGGEKYLHPFTVEIRDQDNEVVARVKKVVYIRQKPPTQKP